MANPIEDEDDAYQAACHLQRLLSAESQIPLKAVRAYANAISKWATVEIKKRHGLIPGAPTE